MPKHLIEGLQRFRSETFPRFRERYQRLVDEGQSPSTLFIGCADSRVVPDLLLDVGPGELFLVRNVGAFVPPFEPDGAYHGTAAGIEYAVLHLRVTDIVVCGHSHCGAVRALYDEPSAETPHITRWLELAREARFDDDGADGDPGQETLRRAEQRSIAIQVGRLMSYPFVRERVEEGTLSLHGWHYIIEDGQVLVLDVEREEFVPAGE
ncbi:MAG: carbonic anhydrase [Candidatus Longimicrobiales bacterium M2_2A_002]